MTTSPRKQPRMPKNAFLFPVVSSVVDRPTKRKKTTQEIRKEMAEDPVYGHLFVDIFARYNKQIENSISEASSTARHEINFSDVNGKSFSPKELDNYFIETMKKCCRRKFGMPSRVEIETTAIQFNITVPEARERFARLIDANRKSFVRR